MSDDFDDILKKLEKLKIETDELTKSTESLDEIWAERKKYKEWKSEEMKKQTEEMIWNAQLEQMDINHIEKFLRKKKLEKLNENKGR